MRVVEKGPGQGVAKLQTIEEVPSLPLTQAAYLPGEAFDEMYAPDGTPRPHYRDMHKRLLTLSAEDLAERQRTLERSFLLQGITFTVYGAESAVERIIPTDVYPRIIPAAEWDHIESGLIQRLTALNLFLSDIYGEQKILKDGIVPYDLVLGAPSFRREMVGLLVVEVAVMAAHPARRHAPLVREREEPLPQREVRHRFAAGIAKALALPAGAPFRHALQHVLAVRYQLDRGTFRGARQALDRRSELGDLVGAVADEAAMRRDLAAIRRDHHGAPGGRTGVAGGARAVGIGDPFGHCR